MYSIEQFNVPTKEEIIKPDNLPIYGLGGFSRVGKGSVVLEIKEYFSPGEVYVPSTSLEIKEWLKNHPTNPSYNPSTKDLYEAGCKMQEFYGEDIFVRKFVLNAKEKFDKDKIVACAIDSFRRAEEAKTAKFLDVARIWVEANIHNRWARIERERRDEDPKDIEKLLELDREQEFELVQVRQLSQVRITNDGTLDDLKKQVQRKLFHFQHPI